MCLNYLTLVKSWWRKIINGDHRHDESHYLARSNTIRSLWKNKEFSALAKFIDADIIALDDRADIAFMIALAHAKLDHRGSYLVFSKLALDWNITPQSMTNIINEHRSGSSGKSFDVRVLNKIEIGIGWAANTINTAIYRHHGLLTIGEYQYTAYYESESVLSVVRISGINVESYKLQGRYRLHDAHNSISLGYDRNNCLHITYDHHGTKLKYRRSEVPYAIDTWQDEASMTGQHEDKVTYPTFINPRFQHPLTLLYRDGESDKGCARLKIFDEQSGLWSDYPVAVLSGENNAPWPCNGYWNHPAIDKNGTLHLSFVWRTHSIGSEQLVNNLNICYAKSDDNGLTWRTSTGIEFKLPITPVNCEVIFPVPPGSNLINQCSMAMDSKNHAHIAYYASDGDGVPQYFHLWQSGKKWKSRQVSNRKYPFKLKGVGTLQIPISRPEIIIDRDDSVHILFRGDLSGNCLSAYSASAPEYVSDLDSFKVIWPLEVGNAEPVIDRTRWSIDDTLALFVQKTGQTNGDIQTDTITSQVSVINVKFTSLNNE